MSSKVFLISPVARLTTDLAVFLGSYVAELEKTGKTVHWPMRDTVQDDPTGGYEICKVNVGAMMAADEIHIWYDETSGGSKFDMGVVFLLVEKLGWRKRIVIVNEEDLVEPDGKCFLKVMRRLIEARHLNARDLG